MSALLTVAQVARADETGVFNLGARLRAGGRYDDLMARFGEPMPAVGVSLDLDTIAEALAGAAR